MSIIEFKPKTKGSTEVPKTQFEGEAVCLGCGNIWTAITESGFRTYLECPECKLFKGVHRGLVDRADPHYSCLCGSLFYSINKEGIYCVKCGDFHMF